jgi:hypothetical protein
MDLFNIFMWIVEDILLIYIFVELNKISVKLGDLIEQLKQK